MKTSKVERERLRGLLAKAQDTTIGSDVRTVRYMLLDHAAVNALPALLDDLDLLEHCLAKKSSV